MTFDRACFQTLRYLNFANPWPRNLTHLTVVSNRNARKLDFTPRNTTTKVRSITKCHQWAAIHESHSQNENGETVVLNEDEDTYGDGLSNAVEFILGTNP